MILKMVRPAHVLGSVDERDRTAECSTCGLVTVKRDQGRWKCCRSLTKKHTIVDPDLEARRGWCRGCREEVDLYLYGRGPACKQGRLSQDRAYRASTITEQRERHAEWRTSNREHIREYQRAKRYGLAPGAFKTLVEAQGGVCKICQVAPRGDGRKGAILHVDHDHETGKVRGLLCDPCNKAIGLLGEDVDLLRRAIDYLS